MSVFRYEALDPTGKTHTGNIEADSARAARHQLRLQGLTPTTLDAIAHRTHKHNNTFSHFARELRSAEVTRLIRELACLLQANLALATALQALQEQAEHPRVREKISNIRAEVMAGQPLHQALNLHPKSFPELVIATVATGEQTGHLGNVLEKLADALEARHTLNQKVSAAFIYPAIVTIVALLVVIGLLTYVVPQVVSVFENTHQQLPTLTVIMIGLSNTLRQWGWLIGLLIGSGIALFRKALHIPQFRLWADTHLLRLPLIGSFIRAVNTARLASTLAILVNSGVPILKALTAANRTLTNHALQQAMTQVHEHVKEGGNLSKALSKSGLFPPVLAHLVASGESTGQLPAMLERASQTQRTEVERKALWLTSLLEPLLILVMGLIVLLIVLAVMMPIIEVNQLVR